MLHLADTVLYERYRLHRAFVCHARRMRDRSSWKRHGHSSPAHCPLVWMLFTCNCTVRACRRVRYPEFGGCPLFGCCYCTIYMETSVGTYGSVRYTVDVRYWECPLMESPLYKFVCVISFFLSVDALRSI